MSPSPPAATPPRQHGEFHAQLRPGGRHGELMVVNNTGLSFINGSFSNLAQGQAVLLSFGGVTYHFVANYYGGTGNDLVLVWAATRPYGWGYNSEGELGNGTLTNYTLPVAVSLAGVLSNKTVVALATGGAVALCSDGTVVSRAMVISATAPCQAPMYQWQSARTRPFPTRRWWPSRGVEPARRCVGRHSSRLGWQ